MELQSAKPGKLLLRLLLLSSALMTILLPKYGNSEIAKFDRTGLEKSIATGKQEMNKIQTIISKKVPHDNECWKAALKDLEVGCSILTTEIQSKLAFAFTSCFSEMIGSPPYLCEKSTPIKECVHNLDATGLATFREYFMHTQDMCFYLQHEIWQEETDRAVNDLTSAAVDVTKNIQDTKSAQEKILVSQQEALTVQANLMKDNNALYNAVVKVKDVFDEFKHSADEHRLIFIEIFEKLSRMQTLVSWIQGEMSLLDTLGFYFASLVFGMLATATRRTRQARFWIIIVFILCLVLERSTFDYFSTQDEPLSPEEIHLYVWYVRRTAAILGIMILVVSGANYQDVQVKNNHMLLEMNSQMHHLMSFVEEVQKRSLALPFVTDFMGSNYGKSVIKGDDGSPSSSSSSSRDGSDESYSNYSTDSEDSLDDLELEQEMKKINSFGSAPIDLPLGCSTPQGAAEQRYPMRARKQSIPNPILKSERPSDFAKLVRSSKILMDRFSTSYYSSDDDF